MLSKRDASSLDGGDLGWLKARHHFVVSEDGNTDHQPLGPLVVWNDDEIAPGSGFGMHGHRNMEIISYVRDGVVTHRDSLGNVGYTAAGDVQVMSAGTGIRHAEHNDGAVPLRLFQIWLKPRIHDVRPRWATRHFPEAVRGGRMTVLASGFEEDKEALPIEADARVLGASLSAGQVVRVALAECRNAYLAPTAGTLDVNGYRLTLGDGLAATDEEELVITAIEGSALILVAAA